MDQYQALFHYLLHVRDRPGEHDMIHRLEAEQVRRQTARDSRRAELRSIAGRFEESRHRRRSPKPTPATVMHESSACRSPA